MGMGCWAIGGPFWAGEDAVGWGEVDDNESIQAIHRALELGVNFFDTADVYGTGHSERILSKALKNCRDRVIIATKFGLTYEESTHQLTGQNATPQYIKEACEASLKRLDTDYIDLYQFHLNKYAPSEAEAVRDTLEDLVNEGKIKKYGWSTDFPECAKVFAEGPNCTAIQSRLNVLEDNPEMRALCEEQDLALINRGPLAMGLLTGKYKPDSSLASDDVRGPKSPAWMKYFRNGAPNPELLNKLEAIREILTSNGRALAQGALAWLWGRCGKAIPIPGFRTVAQVEENTAAMQFGPLGAEQMREIDTLLGR